MILIKNRQFKLTRHSYDNPVPVFSALDPDLRRNDESGFAAITNAHVINRHAELGSASMQPKQITLGYAK